MADVKQAWLTEKLGAPSYHIGSTYTKIFLLTGEFERATKDSQTARALLEKLHDLVNR
jgi:hypothetical protein